MLTTCARFQAKKEFGFTTANAILEGTFAILAWHDALGMKWPMNVAWCPAPLGVVGIVVGLGRL